MPIVHSRRDKKGIPLWLVFCIFFVFGRQKRCLVYTGNLFDLCFDRKQPHFGWFVVENRGQTQVPGRFVPVPRSGNCPLRSARVFQGL